MYLHMIEFQSSASQYKKAKIIRKPQKTLSRKQIYENLNQNDTYEFNIKEPKRNIPNISELKNALEDFTDEESRYSSQSQANESNQKANITIKVIDRVLDSEEEDYKLDL